VTFVRTVLGDIEPSELGVTYSHEHLVIDGGRAVLLEPDFDLSDVDRMATEVAAAAALGLRSVVDAMPCDAGRNVEQLAVRVRLAHGNHEVARVGLLEHSPHRIDVVAGEELAGLFVADIAVGIDALDYGGPVIRRTEYCAGVIKVAGSTGGPSTRDRAVFEAAAAAHRSTGAPFLTHCEGGTGALEQVRLLVDHGVDARYVVLSHVDKIVDREYHRELLSTGAFAEYDGSFRWGDRPNGTLQLLQWMAEDDLIDQVTLGMDAARQDYYAVYGGSPGLGWLLDGFSAAMDEVGLDAAARRRLFVTNPARAFAFRVDHGGVG